MSESEISNPSQNCVLVVDDDQSFRVLLQRWLANAGYATEAFADGESCLSALDHLLPAAVCLDLNLPGAGGLTVLETLRAHQPLLPVVILTADSAVNSAVAAMQLGAYDYLVKPLDRPKLLTTIKNAVERYQMSLRVTQLEREASEQPFPGLIGNSPVLRDMLRQITRIAASDITVLVYGESGTGKELVAKAIHSFSGRGRDAFVPLNCAAIPEALQESELFGHEKGAFTGAINRRIGKFEQANGGTLFLDEVAELSLSLQAKLLRVLQERSFNRLGSSLEIRSDFRMVAASHKNLAEEVKAGRFREDLFFRLAVFELDVPPLRERGGDITLLAQHFLKEYAAGSDPKRLSAAAAQTLERYNWPGNVRELQNYMHRASVTASGELVEVNDLPTRVRFAQPVAENAIPFSAA
ncbi:MAG TPA: sigma-54 dependent transcriptional regulator, partial [Blastocatellia bacterium]|nr:sigma-54 dependent transcriptional regulator [Blastocatellia bacterium]